MNIRCNHKTKNFLSPNLRSRILTHSIMQNDSLSLKKNLSPRVLPPYFTKVDGDGSVVSVEGGSRGTVRAIGPSAISRHFQFLADRLQADGMGSGGGLHDSGKGHERVENSSLGRDDGNHGSEKATSGVLHSSHVPSGGEHVSSLHASTTHHSHVAAVHDVDGILGGEEDGDPISEDGELFESDANAEYVKTTDSEHKEHVAALPKGTGDVMMADGRDESKGDSIQVAKNGDKQNSGDKPSGKEQEEDTNALAEKDKSDNVQVSDTVEKVTDKNNEQKSSGKEDSDDAEESKGDEKSTNGKDVVRSDKKTVKDSSEHEVVDEESPSDSNKKNSSEDGGESVEKKEKIKDNASILKDNKEEEVSNWNFTAITDINTTEHVFAYDNSDHAAMYRPLCIDLKDGMAFTIEGETECSSMHQSPRWIHTHCEPRRWIVQKSLEIYVEKWNWTREWLVENKDHIRWVDDLSVLMILDRGCGNIAHFCGRALLLHHFLQNLEVYVGEARRVANIVIVANRIVMPWLNGWKKGSQWNQHLLRTVVAPDKPVVGKIDDFLEKEQSNRDGRKGRNVHIVPGLTMNVTEGQREYMCFKQVVVPGFFKGRFFLNDTEYPSERASFKTTMKGSPHVPRDSLRLRELLMKSVVGKFSQGEKKREIHLLDRRGSRSFDEEGQRKVIGLLERVAKENGYRFVLTRFDGMSFKEQVVTMKRASIVVGVHGANLVNTMFMDPLAVMIEVFPHRFSHVMYRNGGNSGVKYFSLEMSSGAEFKGLADYDSVKECIKKEILCKVHYRDAMLQVSDGDVKRMEALLTKAMEWWEDLDGKRS